MGHIMYSTTISLTNSTMYPCKSPHAMLVNNVHVNVPGPFSADLKPYKTKLTTTMCVDGQGQKSGGWSCGDNASTAVIGSYLAPEMKLNAGDNQRQFTAKVDLDDPKALIPGFILPLFASMHKAELTIAAEDVDIVAAIEILGVKVGIKVASLKLNNQLTCSMLQILPSEEIPAGVCGPTSEVETGRRLDASAGYMMQCTPGIQRNLAFHTIV